MDAHCIEKTAECFYRPVVFNKMGINLDNMGTVGMPCSCKATVLIWMEKTAFYHAEVSIMVIGWLPGRCYADARCCFDPILMSLQLVSRYNSNLCLCTVNFLCLKTQDPAKDEREQWSV